MVRVSEIVLFHSLKVVSRLPPTFSPQRHSLARQHSALRSPSPDRRPSSPVHASAANAASHHCPRHVEAMPQLRFIGAALQKPVAVQLAISEALVSHPLRPRCPMPRRAPDRFGDSCYDLATRLWSFLGASVIWYHLGPQTLTVFCIPDIGTLLAGVSTGQRRRALGAPLEPPR